MMRAIDLVKLRILIRYLEQHLDYVNSDLHKVSFFLHDCFHPGYIIQWLHKLGTVALVKRSINKVWTCMSSQIQQRQAPGNAQVC